MDVEVAASGFTKDMSDDFEKAMNAEDESESESEDSFEEDGKTTLKVDEWLNNTVGDSEIKGCQEDFVKLRTTDSEQETVDNPLSKTLNDAEERDDGGSVTSRSTIPPDVIRKKCNMEWKRKEKQQQMRHIRSKAAAGSARRERKDNKDVIREYAGWEEL